MPAGLVSPGTVQTWEPGQVEVTAEAGVVAVARHPGGDLIRGPPPRATTGGVMNGEHEWLCCEVGPRRTICLRVGARVPSDHSWVLAACRCAHSCKHG